MLFGAIIFVFCILYRFTVGQPLPYSRLPRNPLIVKLPGYGTFKGTQVLRHLKKDSALDKPIDSWLGVEYARQPVGEYRFAPPDWPEVFNGTKDATEYGPACIQKGRSADQSEACLHFNVFRTPGIPYSKKLPVMVFLHGGAFAMGSGRSFDGALFVSRSTEPIMVVTPNYRLSALGSLPSKLFEEEGLLNLGLLDQRLLLQFLQKYISVFGGDSERITLAGQSAGGHSVGIHLFHNYGDDEGKPLFSQTIISSGSPTSRAFPEATFPLYQRQFDEFMTYLDCPQSPNSEALECLRAADISKIRTKQSQLYSASTYNITWPFQPVSPGPLLENRGSKSGEDGTFWKVPTLISSTTDEGAFFAPKNLKTNDQFISFLATVNPGLTEQDLKDLVTLYPDRDDSDSPYRDSPKSKQFKRITAAYGDYSYICPVQEAAYRLAKAGVPVYKARWNTPNYGQEWQGIPHASDSRYFNGSPDVEFPDIAEMYSSYWASFVVSGDPNKYAAKGAPQWTEYKGLGDGLLKVGSWNGTGTGMEEEGEGIRMEACAWWRDPERMERLKK
jgi:carboxylesterase type B